MIQDVLEKNLPEIDWDNPIEVDNDKEFARMQQIRKDAFELGWKRCLYKDAIIGSMEEHCADYLSTQNPIINQNK